MSEKLTELFERLSNRRTFIGRISAQIVALIASFFGFSRIAQAAYKCSNSCDNSGYATGCCCLCKPSNPLCDQQCASPKCQWFWVNYCDDGTGMHHWLCFECFNSSAQCSGNCNVCSNAFCSKATQYG